MFTKKEYQDRQSEYPNRRKLVPTADSNIYDVQRNEGVVTEQGVPFNADTMNDLESRVEAAFIETSGGMSYTLTHSYDPDTKTHNLTGTIPTTGIATAIYTATSTNAEGDKWTVNGEAYTAKPTGGATNMVSSSFITGDTVSIDINIDTKKISFSGGSGGGGSGKMMQQVSLPISDVYDSTSTEPNWDTMMVNGQPIMSNSCVEDGIIYSAIREYQSDIAQYRVILYEQIYKTKEITKTVFPDHPYAFISTVRYNKHTYFISTVDQNQLNLGLWKLNKETKSFTRISALGACPVSGVPQQDRYSSKVYMVSDSVLIILYCLWVQNSWGSLVGYFYDFDTNALSTEQKLYWADSSKTNTYLHSWVSQKDTNNIFYTLLNVASSSPYIITFNLNTKLFMLQGRFTALDKLSTNNIWGVQIGNTVMYLTTSSVLGSKKNGGIDLINKTYDPIKYPDIPELANPAANNAQLIDDDVVVQAQGKTFSLKLIPVPPETRPPVAYLFKGDVYNAPFIPARKPINVLAIPNQSAFTITNMPQVATEDREIHMGQYDLQGSPTQLLIKKG